MKVYRDLLYLTSNYARDKEMIEFLELKGKLRQVIKHDSNINISGRAAVIVCNAPLTKVASYLKDKNNTIDTLVIMGGFVGVNILKSTMLLGELKGQEVVSDENLSADVESTMEVLNTSIEQVKNVYMMCQNVLLTLSPSEIQREVFNLTCQGSECKFRYLGVNPYYDKESNKWGSGIYLLFKEGRLRLTHSAIGTK